jgi:hypothetical protein
MSLRPKQRLEIGAGLPAEVRQGHTSQSGEVFGDPHNPRRLVAFTPVRRRRKVGAIGFAQNSIGRHERSHLAHILSFWKRNDPRKRDVHAECQGLFGERRRARKAMHHSAHRAAGLLSQDSQRVVLSLAGMNDDGQIELAGEADLQPEDFLLDVPGREIVVIIEADLAECSGFRNRGDHSADKRSHIGLAPVELSRLMWVQADPESQRGPEAAQFSRTLGFSGIFRRENAQCVRQSGRSRPVDDLVRIFYKRIVCKMAMGVDHFAEWYFTGTLGIGDLGLGIGRY